MPYEADLARLEAIVAELEREDIELEDALQLFEEGVSHLRAAEALVARSELLIERLLEEPGGPRLEPVEPTE